MFKPSPVFWIAAGLIIAALEMVIPGFVIIWFGVAGLITGVVAFFVRDPLVQVVIFVVLSAVLVTMSQIISRRLTRPEPESVGAQRFEGASGQVIRTIEPPNTGRVKVGGEEWRAEASVRIEAGAKVRVVRVEGTRLVVELPAERSES